MLHTNVNVGKSSDYPTALAFLAKQVVLTAAIASNDRVASLNATHHMQKAMARVRSFTDSGVLRSVREFYDVRAAFSSTNALPMDGSLSTNAIPFSEDVVVCRITVVLRAADDASERAREPRVGSCDHVFTLQSNNVGRLETDLWQHMQRCLGLSSVEGVLQRSAWARKVLTSQLRQIKSSPTCMLPSAVRPLWTTAQEHIYRDDFVSAASAMAELLHHPSLIPQLYLTVDVRLTVLLPIVFPVVLSLFVGLKCVVQDWKHPHDEAASTPAN